MRYPTCIGHRAYLTFLRTAILTIKKNQSTLFKAAQKLVKSAGASDSLQAEEHLHGRSTTRITTIYAARPQLLSLWAGAKQIIALVRTGLRWQGKKNRRRLVNFHESHYYLSSLDWSASQFSDAIRGQWLIENRLHWVKDVTLNKDNSIHRGGNAPANWARGVTVFSIFGLDEWYEYSSTSFKIDG